MQMTNWKEKAFILLKKFQISISVLWIIYKPYTRVLNFIKYKDPYFFRSVALEISTSCNRTCYYCPNSLKGTPTDFMEESTFNRIIDQLKTISFSGIINYHFYNEPLLDKRLSKFIRHVKKHLPSCINRVVSNGDFLSISMADDLIKAGVADFAITIHDRNDENLLAKLQPVLKKYPGHVRINSIHDKPLYNRGGAIEVELLDKKDTCTDPLELLQLDYKGNVLLCCNDYYRKHSFGNIGSDKIEKIWQREDFSQLRRELRSGVANLEICRICMGKE
ncbi:MAG TPA: radical SAM/SPASM domain-containing protein [Nitrospinaceae bacterium]|nr:radical SAM/SPASM domain-containing protein [Nitrospinaceae bacterium]